jgi:putative endonuclease
MKARGAQGNNRKRSHWWGVVAEYLCAVFLVLKGYSILKLRYRNQAGEIDIIALKAKTLAFIEVKARENTEDALHSVTPAKQAILAQAANIFVAANPRFLHTDLRFDVMVVTSPAKIYHFKDAWRT